MLWSYGRMLRGRRPTAVQAHIDALAAALTQHLGAPSEDGWVTSAQSPAGAAGTLRDVALYLPELLRGARIFAV